MIKVNKNKLTPQTWSIRDIKKILLRLKNQKLNPDDFISIGTAENLLFYELSSISSEQIPKIEELVNSLKKKFLEIESKKMIYYKFIKTKQN